MNKKVSIGTMITVAILAMAATFSITMLAAMRRFDSTIVNVKEKEEMYEKLSQIDRYVRSNSYYTLNENVLNDMLASGYMVGSGDRYAKYYNVDAYAELLQVENGTRIGIGVELAKVQNGYMEVIQVYSGSPAAELGMTKGCYIIAVDGVDVRSLSSAEAVEARLRGETGTVTNITWRNTMMEEQNVDITRFGYTTSTVEHGLAAPEVGYLRIWQFNANTASELDYAMRALNNLGAKTFIFDLRDNFEGKTEDVMRCLDLVCPEGILAYAVDKAGIYTALGTGSGMSPSMKPSVCLVNGRTAGMAELFASCMQSLDGAILVGTNTAGRGMLQSDPVQLSDGSAVSIATAILEDGAGNRFEGKGLTVKFEATLTADEEALYYEFTAADDPQVQRAVTVARSLSGSTVDAVTVAGSTTAEGTAEETDASLQPTE